MIIYGVAFLALCTLFGLFIGELLGKLLGIPANVGGVGIAMLLLIFLGKRGLFTGKAEQGVEFWSDIYIPIVVAMAAQQNVLGALSGGPMAILAGTVAVLASFAMVPLLDRLGQKKPEAVTDKSLTTPQR